MKDAFFPIVAIGTVLLHHLHFTCGFSSNPSFTSTNTKLRTATALSLSSDTPSPPSTDENDVTTIPQEDDNMAQEQKRTSLKTAILMASSRTDRGQNASPADKRNLDSLLTQLESLNPTAQPTFDLSSLGTWELAYSSTQLFRSSPFFMAGRAVCATAEEASRYDWFCDQHREALAISRIGKVRQIISETRLTSEFEVKVGAIPFLNDFTPFSYSGGWPITITGSIVSAADATPTSDGMAWELLMDDVRIKGSNIPLLRNALDAGLRLDSRALGTALESAVSGYENPRPVFEVTYLDDELRISRDQDGKVFLYVKISDDVEETDYEDVKADLGVSSLWEGYSKAILGFD